jgi:ATP adenylyltransferase
MAYILAGDDQAPECIFCAFPAQGPEHFREHLILAVAPQAFVMMNKFPYANGHLLVVPRRHVARPDLLEAGEWASTCELLRAATVSLGQALGAANFNIGMNLGRAAGAGIEAHCHWHVVPRWAGDTNFMPLLAETRMINEHLEATYGKLLPAFRALGEGPPA